MVAIRSLVEGRCWWQVRACWRTRPLLLWVLFFLTLAFVKLIRPEVWVVRILALSLTQVCAACRVWIARCEILLFSNAWFFMLFGVPDYEVLECFWFKRLRSTSLIWFWRQFVVGIQKWLWWFFAIVAQAPWHNEVSANSRVRLLLVNSAIELIW